MAKLHPGTKRHGWQECELCRRDFFVSGESVSLIDPPQATILNPYPGEHEVASYHDSSFEKNRWACPHCGWDNKPNHIPTADRRHESFDRKINAVLEQL